MLTPDDQTKHLLTIEISSQLYTELQSYRQATGWSESDLVTQGLRNLLDQAKTIPNLASDQVGDSGDSSDNPDAPMSVDHRFDQLALGLEKRLKLYVEDLVRTALNQNQHQNQSNNRDAIADNLSVNAGNPENLSSDQNSSSPNSSNVRPMPLPTIRPLQVGDRVLVLEPDSPYYMAKVLIVKTSLIRATVATETGEYSFLKRDLRFVEEPSS